MDYKEAVKHSKNKKGMKQSVNGLFSNSSELLEAIGENRDGIDHGSGYAFALKEMSEHYYQARKAWLTGDLETVAEFFGLYV